jgi:hypothetical protein
MASLDAVSELSCKAVTLQAKGHSARAAENFRAALAAARARTPATPPDCLIVAALQLHVITCSLVHIEQETVLLAAKAEVVWEAMTVLLPEAVATLRCRRDAGTLLGGKCRAAEEAWQRGQAGAIMRAFGKSDADAARFSALVGYATFLLAATTAFSIGESAQYHNTLRALGILEREAHLQAHHALTCALAEEAVTLMSAPRRRNEEYLANEVQFVRRLLAYGVSGREGPMLPEPHRARAASAFRRLQASGMLTERNIAAGLVAAGEEIDATSRASMAAAASSRLRGCGLAACGAREAHPAHFKLCAACKAVAYCCREHQAQGWAEHKAACKATRSKAAAESAAAPSGSAA